MNEIPPRPIALEDAARDIDRVLGLYERVHPEPVAGFPVRRPAGDLSRLKDKLVGPLSRLELYRLLAPILNGTGDEHTHLMLPARELRAYAESGGLFFPFTLGFIGGRAIVASRMLHPGGDHQNGQDYGSDGDIPPGSELVSIDSRPLAEITACLRGFFSGTSDVQRLYFLGQSFPEAWYLGYGQADSFRVEWKPVGGEHVGSATVRGVPIPEVEHQTGFPILNESPLRYRADNGYRRFGDTAMVLDFRAFENPRGRFGALLDEMFSVAAAEHRDTLVVDLRKNIGGDSFVAAALLSRLATDEYFLLQSSDLQASVELKEHFLRFIPAPLRILGIQHLHPWTRALWKAEPGRSVSIAFKPSRPRRAQDRFAGRVIFLSGPGDYSSSAILLGAVKHYGFGTIAGEASGGYPTHYGNCTRHVLPCSALEILIPASVNHGWGSGPVEPDVVVMPTQADLAAGRDAALEALVRV